MKQLIKRPAALANVGYADEANPDKFYLVKDNSNNKTYFLVENSAGEWEWMDLGSRGNLSTHPHNSFEHAIAFVTEDETNDFSLTEHDTRMGALTNLLDRTREAVRVQEQLQNS